MFGTKRNSVTFTGDELKALCAAVPFAVREVFPQLTAENPAQGAYSAARSQLQGTLKSAFIRVLEKLIPFGKRYDTL